MELRKSQNGKKPVYGQDLSGTDFSCEDLSKAQFHDCQLQNAVFDRAVLDDALFENCDLSGAVFNGVSASGVKFRKSRGNGVRASFVRFEKSQFEDSEFDDLKADDCLVRSSSFMQCKFIRSELPAITLDNVEMRRTRLLEVGLSYARIVRSVLDGVVFERCGLYAASFLCSELSDSVIKDSFCPAADFRGVTFAGGLTFRMNRIDCLTTGVTKQCPDEGSFVAYTRAKGGALVKLEIPDDAQRMTTTTSRCMSNKATVLAITAKDGTPMERVMGGWHDRMEFAVGHDIRVASLGMDTGIPFFVSRDVALSDMA